MIPSTIQLIPIDFSNHTTIVIPYFYVSMIIEEDARLSHCEKVISFDICIDGMLAIQAETDGGWLMSTD